MHNKKNWFGRRLKLRKRLRQQEAHKALPLVLEPLEDRLVLASGLVAAYGFHEGSGQQALDSSGNGNTGVISNDQWSTAGIFGTALSFNGTDSLVTVADSPSLDLTGGMTLEAWVKPTDLGGWRDVLLKERPGDLSYALYASDGGTPGALPYGQISTSSGPDQTAEGTTALPKKAWSYLAATYDGSTLSTYGPVER
jgi:hypothetical protein